MKVLALALLLSPLGAFAAPPAHVASPALVVDLDTGIHAVTADFIQKSIREAETARAPFVVIRINTPGGRIDSTREITQSILASKVPVIGFVTPPGGQAASGGFFVLMACDVAAMAPGTNAGAASPVMGDGADIPKTMSKKIMEDTSALMRSLVGPRGRPAEPAVKTITDAVSYSETEGLEKKLVEIVARDLPDLFAQLDGRTIKRVGKPDEVLKSKGAAFTVHRMTELQKLLGVVANPGLAGILFLLGLAGLYAEMQHPGAVFPGVIGGICLLLALFSMSVLPTNYAGVALLLLGVLFFFLEVKLASHGFFAIGGGIAMILGAVLLFHQDELAPKGDFWFVVGTAVATTAVFAVLSFEAISLQRLPVTTGSGALVGLVVPARTPIHETGKVFADGDLWDARSSEPIAAGEKVQILAVEGLSLVVKRVPGAPNTGEASVRGPASAAPEPPASPQPAAVEASEEHL